MADRKKDLPLNKFEDGEWQVSNLKFLADFIKAEGLSLEQAAAKMDLSRQAVYYWFATDDAKISTILTFLDRCGYTIDFALERKETMRGNAWVKIDIRKKVHEGCKNVRLAFLEKALKAYGIRKKALARKMGLGDSAVFYWLKQDDCLISYIYRIAEAEGLDVKIHIQPK